MCRFCAECGGWATGLPEKARGVEISGVLESSGGSGRREKTVGLGWRGRIFVGMAGFIEEEAEFWRGAGVLKQEMVNGWREMEPVL